jgi:hypothetical protein
MGQSLNDERRSTRRVPTVLPICFEWHYDESELRRTRGTTRDISNRGVYSFIERALTPGLPVEFEVVFPAEVTASEPLKLRCAGRILRTEALGRRFGAATSIDSYEVIDVGETLADSDRRAHLRIVPPEAIVAEYPGLRSVIRDVSPTGAFVEDDRPFPVGRVIDLRLRGEGLEAPIEVKAVVRRIEPQIGMAVEFVALSKQARERLLMFIARNRGPRVDDALRAQA